MSHRKVNGYSAILEAAPLVEVFSVSIHNNGTKTYDDVEKCQIYGRIQAFDAQGYCYELYNRTFDEAESVCMGGKLMLTGPKDVSIAAIGEVEVEIDLMDKTRDVEFVKGVFYLDYKNRDDYDKVLTNTVEGKYGSADVCYITYQAAVIADIVVSFVKDVNVYGSVYACCVNGVNYPFNDVTEEYAQKKEHSSILLFQRPLNDPLLVKDHRSVGLLRKIVAVPANSILLLDVSLSTCDAANPISLNGIVKFEPCEYGVMTKTIDGKSPNEYILAGVQWSSSYVQCPIEERQETHTIKQCKTTRLLSGKPFPLDYPLFEVFSISLGCDDDKMMQIYGTILARDEHGSYDIFRRDIDSPEVIYPYNKLTSLNLCGLRGHDVCFEVDLKDVEGRLFSKGKLEWNANKLEFPEPWYDNFLCSIIPGENIYTMFHYTIMSSGLEAMVSIRLSVNTSSDVPLSMFGSVLVSYKSYEYGTYYLSEYYKGKLFERGSENPLLLSSNSEIPLSKSKVFLPIDSNLHIEVNLHMMASSGDEMTDEWCGLFEVKTGSRFFQTLEGKSHRIDLLVAWS